MGQLRNPHPGEILKENFSTKSASAKNQLAQAIGVPGNRIHAIVNGTRDIRLKAVLVAIEVKGNDDGTKTSNPRTDNVLADLGFDDAEELSVKAVLAMK